MLSMYIYTERDGGWGGGGELKGGGGGTEGGGVSKYVSPSVC